MAYTKGQTVTASTAYKTHQVAGGGGKTYDMAAGTSGVIKDVRGDWVDVDYSGIGGGTGWVLSSVFDQQQAPAQAPAPTQPQQVQPFLNQTQQALATQAAMPTVRTTDEILKSFQDVLPTQSQRPQPISLTGKFQELRTANGVDDLEASLNELKAQEDEIATSRRIRIAGERSKRISLDAASGAISEIEYQERENLNFVQLQKARVVDELNMRYNTINMLMDLTQKEYQMAKEDFDSRFNQAIQMIDLVRGIQKDEKDEQQRHIDNARATLTTTVNLIKEGNLDINTISPDQRVNLAKMSVIAGFPPDFIGSIRMDAKANLLDAAPMEDGRVQLIFRNPDGSIRTEIQGQQDPLKLQAAELKRRETEASIASSNRANQPKDDPRATQLATSANLLINRVLSRQDKYMDKNEFNREVKLLQQEGYDEDTARSIIFRALDTGKIERYPKGATF